MDLDICWVWSTEQSDWCRHWSKKDKEFSENLYVSVAEIFTFNQSCTFLKKKYFPGGFNISYPLAGLFRHSWILKTVFMGDTNTYT